MALNAYLKIKGAKQGDIKGSVTQKGLEGNIAVFAFHHEISSPRDSSSGLATGKRQHKPITITKEIDKSSTLLLTALITNENLTEILIRFFTPQTKAATGTGIEVQHYTIKLTNASIFSITGEMLNNKIEADIKLPLLEVVSFNYQKIEWTWMDGGLLAKDEWTSFNG